jgi:hypothetical protein
MDNTVATATATVPATVPTQVFSDSRNIVIIVLLLVILFTFIGINVLTELGQATEKLGQLLSPLVSSILGLFGYTTGSVINKSADVAGSAARFGLDIAQGAVQDVGGLIKNTSTPYVNDFTKTALDSVLTPRHDVSYVGEYKVGLPPPQQKQARPDTTESPIQKPIAASKSNWCLVGEFKGSRGCVEVQDQSKCLSGQIFPSQKQCLNPAGSA